MLLRHQLAVYSPITANALLRAAAAAAGLGADPREALLQSLVTQHDALDGVLCGSGTQALQVAIATAVARVGPDTSVALPGFSCFDMVSGAIGGRARIALYDIDPDTLGPNWASLERVLKSGARVVVVAYLYGVPIDWSILSDMASKHGALVIEDAAQGHGGAWRDRRLGSLGDISTLSFGRGKGWTGGKGGAVLFRTASGPVDPPVRAVRRRAELTAVVAGAAQWAFGRPAIYGLPRAVPALGLGMTSYVPPAEPTALTRAAAAALIANRNDSTIESSFRRHNGEAMREVAQGTGNSRAARLPAEGTPGYLRFPVRLTGAKAERAVSIWGRRLGIERSYPLALQELSALGDFLAGPERAFPGAQELVRTLFTIPTHSLLNDEERSAVMNFLSTEDQFGGP